MIVCVQSDEIVLDPPVLHILIDKKQTPGGQAVIMTLLSMMWLCATE